MFICGGAFDGLDKIIEKRMGEKVIGFNSLVEKTKEKTDEVLKQVQSEDLLKFGLIPEFIGRLPSIVTLEELDQDALVKIITKPKNALVKQYKRLFELNDVQLEVEKGTVKAIAKKALEKKTGARGLRNIMENVMRDIMYEIPSRDDVEKCVITEKSIEDAKPKLVLREAKPASEKPMEEKKNEPA